MADLMQGMTVYSADGENLGKLVRTDAHGLVIEKGFFFPTDYTCSRDDVAQVRDNEIRLRLTRAELTKGLDQDQIRSASEAQDAAEQRDEELPGPVPATKDDEG